MIRSCFLSILILLVVATTAYSHPTPNWDPAHIKEFRLLKHAKEVRVIKDVPDINAFAQCLSCADTIVKVTFWSFVFGSSKYKESKYKFNTTIDVIGDKPESGRWMYDSVQGVFTYLDPFIQSVYKLNEKDREVVNRFFETDASSLKRE